MGILGPIAAALGSKPTTPQVGKGPGYNPAPFPKQNNPRLNAEAAASGIAGTMAAHADRVHPVASRKTGGY